MIGSQSKDLRTKEDLLQEQLSLKVKLKSDLKALNEHDFKSLSHIKQQIISQIQKSDCLYQYHLQNLNILKTEISTKEVQIKRIHELIADVNQKQVQKNLKKSDRMTLEKENGYLVKQASIIQDYLDRKKLYYCSIQSSSNRSLEDLTQFKDSYKKFRERDIDYTSEVIKSQYRIKDEEIARKLRTLEFQEKHKQFIKQQPFKGQLCDKIKLQDGDDSKYIKIKPKKQIQPQMRRANNNQAQQNVTFNPQVSQQIINGPTWPPQIFQK